MLFKGVRISWLTSDRNKDLARLVSRLQLGFQLFLYFPFFPQPLAVINIHHHHVEPFLAVLVRNLVAHIRTILKPLLVSTGTTGVELPVLDLVVNGL